MSEFLTILILVPTAAVLASGVLYIVAMVGAFVVGGVDAIVVAVKHRLHERGTHYGTPVLHH